MFEEQILLSFENHKIKIKFLLIQFEKPEKGR